MTKDWYGNYCELAASESNGKDYNIVAQDRRTNALIMAPHGGAIEPGTSQIARAVAGSDCSIYLFEGLRPGRKHCELHITSASFDEPQAIRIAQNAQRLVAIHGRADRDDNETVWLGGLDIELVNDISASLNAAAFKVKQCSDELAGRHPMNICNRSKSNMGVQLEIPRTFRDLLVKDTAAMMEFANTIRSVLSEN